MSGRLRQVLLYVVIGIGLFLEKIVKAKSIVRGFIFVYISTITDQLRLKHHYAESDDFEI